MPDIKQKQRTPIKNINKKIVYSERIKDHAVNVKNRTNDFINSNEDSNPTDTATQNIVDTEKIAVAKPQLRNTMSDTSSLAFRRITSQIVAIIIFVYIIDTYNIVLETETMAEKRTFLGALL